MPLGRAGAAFPCPADATAVAAPSVAPCSENIPPILYVGVRWKALETPVPIVDSVPATAQIFV